jgi:hypothetical protein
VESRAATPMTSPFAPGASIGGPISTGRRRSPG